MNDLRLLGLALPQRDVAELTHEVLPWSACIHPCGNYLHLLPLQLKCLLLVAAALHMMVFHLLPYRRVHEWGGSKSVPFAAKLAGALSLTLWIGVVACGRWIGFM